MPAYTEVMSNDMNRPAPQTSTDRPTATYPTDPAAIWADPAGYQTDWLADRTPTATYPAGYPQAAPHVRTNAPQNEGAIQDMWRPRRLPAWHPSLMQLAIGAALVLAIIGACNVAAIQAHREARAYCHALVVSDWDRAQRECRGTGASTPVPEQVPVSAHTSAPAPAQAPQAASPAPSPSALTRVTSPSSSGASGDPSPAAPSADPASAPRPDWVTRDTGAPYDRTDPGSSPLDLPRCTPAPSTPLPCLAHVSSDARHAVVLEEDSSLTGLVRR